MFHQSNLSNKLYDQVYNVKSKVKGFKGSSDDKRLKEACCEFEAIFIAELLKKGFNSAEQLSNQKKPLGYKIMRDLFIEESAVYLAKSGGIGLWKLMYNQLLQEQGVKK